MRSILTIFIVFIGFSVFSQKIKWEDIKNAPVITPENATSVTDYENTPESVVSYFFASFIRRDSDWENVVPEQKSRSGRLKNHLSVYQEDWTFTEFHLVSKAEPEKGKCLIKFHSTVKYGDNVDTGVSEIELELIDGKWVITSVPITQE